MTEPLSHDKRYEINQEVLLRETDSQQRAHDKLPEIIAKHNLGKPLSIGELNIIARKIFRIFGRSNEIILSTNFLNACAELLFASKAEFKEKQDNLMLLFVDEIRNIPFHPTSSEPTANKILKHFIDANKVDDTNRDDFLSAIHLLMKFFTRHGDYCINPSLNVEVRRFKMYVQPYPDNNRMIDFFLFRNWHQHDKYIDVMRPRPPIKSLIQFCKICKINMSTPDFRDSKMFPTIEDLILLIAKEGIKCTCWRKFVEANPGRNIQPCSAKCCDGSLCPFCDQYKEMQFMEFIAVINDSFKNSSLSEDVYNDLFDTFCQIIIGGSTMPVMPLMTKLLFYLPSVSIELYQKLFNLIAKFEIFFRRMNCLPRPNFLSKPNLRDFTKADYDAYMDELKRGQEHFETDIPKLGFCCCIENIEYRDRLEERRKMIEQRNHDEKVADAAVARFKGISVNRC
jgi:hypothetical protein